MFLFDWGSIAGSPEFKAFLLSTAELQVVRGLVAADPGGSDARRGLAPRWICCD
jgi:hypothetical protein